MDHLQEAERKVEALIRIPIPTETEFTLPVTESGDLDYQYMESVVESMPYWSYVRDSFEV